MVSVIIPFYNEEKTIEQCLESLSRQSYEDMEIILVNDGSSDNSKFKIQNSKLSPPSGGILAEAGQLKIKNFKILEQEHQGPGAARNLGAKHAKGDILIFVDADMTFDKDFIKELVAPIKAGKGIGTFSKEEYLLNKNNDIAVCWNINRYILNKWKLDSQVYSRMLPAGYPDKQEVFRAIKKSGFMKVGGFDSDGYTDDWTLSKKLGSFAVLAPGARYYHKNPSTPYEIFHKARWIGGNKFLTGDIRRILFNLFRYSLIMSVIISVPVSIKVKRIRFIYFKIIYDFGIWLSVLESFFRS